MKKYDLIVCGGTFDLLHIGHKKFLQDILTLSDKVLLGITSNEYVSRFKNEQIEDFEIRKNNVTEFLESIGAKKRAEIVSIDQADQPLLTSEFNPEAIAVTPETEKTAVEINQKRKELSLPELTIEIIEMEKTKDNALISSTRIRNGEINRDGRLYINPRWKNKTLKLPEELRPELHKPFGQILDSVPSGLTPDKTITVGDITTQKFNEKIIDQFLSIIDFQVKRQKKFDKLSDLGFDKEISAVVVRNEHGTISPELLNAVKIAFQAKTRQIIQVDGEEDLAFLPVMLSAPLGFTVFYGQPDEGLVEVKVTEENKGKIYDLVDKFEY